jgi:hypothetical protein
VKDDVIGIEQHGRGSGVGGEGIRDGEGKQGSGGGTPLPHPTQRGEIMGSEVNAGGGEV